MTSISIGSVNTKLEAYKLIHDPTRLLSLLFSKYGDIEDDFFISYTNQLLFNIPSKFNRTYKESQFINNIREFLHRYYRKRETKERIPKLSDYYKNYVKFFCRPFFKQISMGKIVHNYQDKQAEIFYKKNYNETLDYEKEKEKENSDKKSFDELSSLDNITNNKIIFDDRTKKIIDNDLKNEMCTLTLESSKVNNSKLNNDNNEIYKGELISKRSNANNSFENVIHYLINSQFKKKIENKKEKNSSKSKKKLINSPSAHPPYIAKIFKNNYHNINSLNREMIPKNKKIKNSLYTLSKNNFIRTGGFINFNYNRALLSPKFTKSDINPNTNNVKNTKYENFKNSMPNNYTNSFQNFSKKNNVNYSNNIINNSNTKKIVKSHNSNRFNINTIYKNFSNLSETLNKYKQIGYKRSNKTTFTNKNISNLSKSKRTFYGNSSNLLTKSNNNISKNKNLKKNETTRINKIDNLILKQNKLKIPKNSNSNLKMNMYNLNIYHTKNKTFDYNSLYSNEQLSKFNTNNNFNNLRIFYKNKGHIRKKISSKFSLIKKPITEVVTRIMSPTHKNSESKMNKDKSLSNNKNRDKTKKIFFGLNQANKNNKIKTHKFDSPKMFSFSRKNMTFTTEENNKKENINIEPDFKTKKKNYTTNRKNIKEENLYSKKKDNLCNWKIKTSCASPLANYTSNYNKLIKNKIYGSFNNTIKNSNYSLNKKEQIKSSKKTSVNKINNELDNNTNILFNNSNRINKEFLEIMGENQIFSRNKKQNTSKILSTKSQNEINLRDICIKTVKSIKPKSIGSKISLNINNKYLNKNKKNNIINNFNKINSSSELHNSQKKNILTNLHMKRISLKKKVKKFSQRMNSKNNKQNCYRKKVGNNNNKINVIFNGDVIINKNQLIEIRPNNISSNKNNNNDVNKNKNGIVIINNINKDRGNSMKIINVNRNINLINKKEQNINT
jgi:hypothetical protein